MPSTITLGEVLDVQNGFAFKSELFSDGDVGVPLIRIRDLKNPCTEVRFVGEYMEEYVVNAGDYLIGMDGDFEIHQWRGEPGLLNQRVCRLKEFSDEIEPEYVYYAIQEKLREIHESTAFVTVKHLSSKQIKSIEIPYHPIDEQRHIVDILKRADGIRRLRKQAQDTAHQLIPALFIDMFGDPATNPKGWDVVTFADVGILDRGKSKHRPRNDPALFGGPYPFIQTGDVANSGGVIRKFSATYSEAGLQQSRLWPAGTLCITIAANIADTATLGFDACFPDSVVGFIPNNMVTTEYVQYWLSFLKPVLESSAPQLAQKNINLKILRSLPIIVPPIELQNKFSSRLESLQSMLLQQERAGVETSVDPERIKRALANDSTVANEPGKG